jgi:hypothetical protein
MQPALHAQSVTFMLLATVLHSRTTVTCVNTESYLPTTDVGEDGALEIILQQNYYKNLFVWTQNMK